uniref:Lon proteolytic domain-containing protein n=1 Tax=viral metagenome TaxID=1070528 RepID=A0A6C0H5F0_9ZZZZ
MSVYEEKLEYFKKVIDDIAKGLNYYAGLHIMTYNEYNNAFSALEKTINIINSINYENIIDELQYINNSISSIIKNYGCYSFEDIINICLACSFAETNFTNDLSHKYKLLVKHLHPLNYNIINWTAANAGNAKTLSKLKIIDDKTLLECDSLECFDLARTNTNFIIKVHGIKVIIHDSKNQKTLVINCLCDDLLALNNSNKFIINKKESIAKYITANGLSTSNCYNAELWNNFLNNYSLKELLIYSPCDLYNKYSASVNQIDVYSQKTLEMLVQDFISFDLYNQRAMLIQLLLINNKADNLYIAYILYDILSNDKNASANDQIKLYNSLNWNCKKHLKNALQKTVEYTNELLTFETAKIPLEQSIYFMKANINVKEKALHKLKEIKSKSEDTGSKARQYLDGLLKIPFAIYKEEEILKIKYEISSILNNIINPLKNSNFLLLSANRDISNILTTIHSMKNNNNIININIIEKISANKVVITNELLMLIAEYIEHNKKKITASLLKSLKLKLTSLGAVYDKKLFLKANLLTFIKSLYINPNIINELVINELLLFFKEYISSDYYNYLFSIEKHINQINRKNGEIIAYMNNFNNILDKAVYGHKKAKLQIERIVGQWINGESSGYCFGFEGLPGIGKTSLAQKGLAHCLKDINNKPRPFSLIALGGSSNGSILEGHNYTYVGSTWGKIVDILMEHKCMNPIIFIDELDKVSKTEHGKELIGILTHLVDSTQNTHFQDKYFSNIDLDLSKVLFIFSYNDVELLDKILLDRIHRIKFDILTLDDKLIIARDYLLPELYAKFHFDDILIFEEEELRFIIEHYTNESGVRKLKEVLFEIISSFNLMLLKNNKCYELPYKISREFIEELLRDRFKISYLTIISEPKVGIINGLWANSYGNSGIIHIESCFFHSTNFLELKLTGLQGDIMKESNAVAKTLAYNLLSTAEKIAITKELEKSKMQGIHIHVPEGATPKDGPSAGAAITLVLYSLLSKRKIRNNIAITGEICLQGNITAIGGLDLKILGGLRAGVTTFYYPKANAKDYKIFYEKYEKNMSKIKFVELENIEQAIAEIII